MVSAEATGLVRLARSADIGWYMVDLLCGNRIFTFVKYRKRFERMDSKGWGYYILCPQPCKIAVAFLSGFLFTSKGFLFISKPNTKGGEMPIQLLRKICESE